jgi:hypothetical protein
MLGSMFVVFCQFNAGIQVLVVGGLFPQGNRCRKFLSVYKSRPGAGASIKISRGRFWVRIFVF